MNVSHKSHWELRRANLENRIRQARITLGVEDDHEGYTKQVVSLTGVISDRNCTKAQLLLVVNHYEALAKKVKKKK